MPKFVDTGANLNLLNWGFLSPAETELITATKFELLVLWFAQYFS